MGFVLLAFSSRPDLSCHVDAARAEVNVEGRPQGNI